MIGIPDFNEINKVVAYLRDVPFYIRPNGLYSAKTLYDGFNPKVEESFLTCYDTMIYQHFLSTGKIARNVEEMLARTLHDHNIHAMLRQFFKDHDHRYCLGIMGGHALQRTDAMFREIAKLSKKLTEEGFFMISGGGPGAMEATHLGAWMAGRSMEELEHSFEMLAIAPSFKDKGWLSSAFRVIEKYPQEKYVSLGIPTWLYGHEPSTPFATHIAKLFENSIREDSILTLAFGGIIYAPGSAGTVQEIFQEAVQNHYLSFGVSSPMIFLGSRYWNDEMPFYPLIKGLMETGKYKNLRLTLTDNTDQIVDELKEFRKQIGHVELKL